MEITWVIKEIIIAFVLLWGILIGYLIRASGNANPITKLKVNTIYFQDESGPSCLLLRQSGEKTELKLYNIKGANRKKMPKVFAVTDKEGDTYKIVPYEPSTIGGPSDEFPEKITN